MHENLPSNLMPGQYAVQPDVHVEMLPAAPDTQVYNPDAYRAVCVHVRETSYTASTDPNVSCNHVVPVMTQGGGAIPPSRQPAFQQPLGGKRKPRLISPALAAWICVLQLGVIIWMLAGHTLHVDCAALTNLKDSVVGQAGDRLAFLAPAIGPLSLDFGKPDAGPKTAHGTRSKNKGKHSKKNGGFGVFAWPTTHAMVPPPPPTIPSSKLTVPPPPVEFTAMSGPGAVAASTLPPPVAGTARESQASSAQAAEVAVHTTRNPSHAAPSQHEDWAAGANIDSQPPVDLESSLPATPAPSPVASLPIAAEPVQSTPIMARAAQPSPRLVRTVMAGSRKRIITDR